MIRRRSVYEGFDRVVCVTLEDNVERHAKLERVFADLDVEPLYYRAKRHERGGRYGCFESHYKVALGAHSDGLDDVLVLEDDVVPTPSYDANIMRDVLEFMRRDEMWESVQFGYGPSVGMVVGGRVTKNLARHLGVFTHAICFSSRGLSKIVANAPAALLDGVSDDIPHYDHWLCGRSKFGRILDPRNCYCVIPMQLDQTWCFETTNVPASYNEVLIRQIACVGGERMRLIYYWSLLAYHRVTILIVLAVCITAVLLVAKSRDHLSKGGFETRSSRNARI